MRFVEYRPTRPLFLYDGECAFCRRWAQRFAAWTGGGVDFAPYQTKQVQFPEIPEQKFREFVQLIETDGFVYAGAEAIHSLLRFTPGCRWMEWGYRHLPGWKLMAEVFYKIVSNNRYKL